MKRTLRSWISTLLLALLISLVVCGTACASTIPEHTSNFYVNDFAGVFTDEQIKVMMDKAVALCEEYDGVQVVITTVQSLDGETVENYANQMYNKYKIGKDSMGVLVLMSVNDRKIRVEVGRNMQAYIPDSRAGKLMNTYAIPKLKQDMFAEGLMDLQEALVADIRASLSGTAIVESEEENVDVWLWYYLGFTGIVLVCLIGVGIYTRYKEEEEQERLKRMLEYRKMWDYPVSKMYSESYPISSKYSSGSNTGYSNYSDDSSSSKKSSSSSNNNSYTSSSFDDSSSYSGFDGCSDGGGASGDF